MRFIVVRGASPPGTPQHARSRGPLMPHSARVAHSLRSFASRRLRCRFYATDRGRRLTRRHRQRHGERAALSWRARERDPAAVRLDDALHETEAEAGALDLRRDDIRRAIERIEDLLL